MATEESGAQTKKKSKYSEELCDCIRIMLGKKNPKGKGKKKPKEKEFEL